MNERNEVRATGCTKIVVVVVLTVIVLTLAGCSREITPSDVRELIWATCFFTAAIGVFSMIFGGQRVEAPAFRFVVVALLIMLLMQSCATYPKSDVRPRHYVGRHSIN